MKEIFESISKYWRFVKEQKYALYDCTSTSVDKKWQKIKIDYHLKTLSLNYSSKDFWDTCNFIYIGERIDKVFGKNCGLCSVAEECLLTDIGDWCWSVTVNLIQFLRYVFSKTFQNHPIKIFF